MKTCPICKTQLFDDMEVCYGCMYTFGSKPELEQRTAERCAQQQAGQAQQAQAVERMPQPTAPMAGWSVRLEMRDVADPTRSWSMELGPSQMTMQPKATDAPCEAIM